MKTQPNNKQHGLDVKLLDWLIDNNLSEYLNVVNRILIYRTWLASTSNDPKIILDMVNWIKSELTLEEQEKMDKMVNIHRVNFLKRLLKTL